MSAEVDYSAVPEVTNGLLVRYGDEVHQVYGHGGGKEYLKVAFKFVCRARPLTPGSRAEWFGFPNAFNSDA